VRELELGLLDVLAVWSLLVDGTRFGALEDVLLRGGDVLEDFRVEVEVLGDDGLGGVCYTSFSIVNRGRG
jgi:hypothetical protein